MTTFPLPVPDINHRLRGFAWRLVRHVPRRRDALDDLVSEAWVAILQHANRYRAFSSDNWWALVRKRAFGAMRDFLRKERQGGLTWVAHHANVLHSLDAMPTPDLHVRPFGRSSIVTTDAPRRTVKVSTDYKKRRAHERRQMELCRDCPNYSGTTVLCETCREKQAARHQRLQRDMSAYGLSPRGGLR